MPPTFKPIFLRLPAYNTAYNSNLSQALFANVDNTAKVFNSITEKMGLEDPSAPIILENRRELEAGDVYMEMITKNNETLNDFDDVTEFPQIEPNSTLNVLPTGLTTISSKTLSKYGCLLIAVSHSFKFVFLGSESTPPTSIPPSSGTTASPSSIENTTGIINTTIPPSPGTTTTPSSILNTTRMSNMTNSTECLDDSSSNKLGHCICSIDSVLIDIAGLLKGASPKNMSVFDQIIDKYQCHRFINLKDGVVLGMNTVPSTQRIKRILKDLLKREHVRDLQLQDILDRHDVYENTGKILT